MGALFSNFMAESASAGARPFGEGSREGGDFHLEQREHVVRLGEIAVSSHPLELPGEVGGTRGGEEIDGSLQGVSGEEEGGRRLRRDRVADLCHEFRGLDGEELYEVPEAYGVSTDASERGFDVEHIARVPLDR